MSELRKRLLETDLRDFEVNEEPVWHATVTGPGLSVESMDRNGNPKMQSLMLISSLCRLYTLNVPYDEYGSTLFDWATLTEKALGFAAATEISVTRAIYDPAIKKKSFKGKLTLGNVGNTSVTNVTQLYIPGVAEPAFHQLTCIVTVSKETRKAQPLPDWFIGRYKGKGCLDKGLRVVPLQRPSNTFVNTLRVAWSDTDNYNHTNFASYVRFAVDALHRALLDAEERSPAGKEQENESSSANQNSALKGVTKKIIINGMKNIKILYLSECTEGQELDVHIWQDASETHTVKCAIERAGTDICHLTLEYFDSSS